MAYRSFGTFRQASTHLDTPPFSQSHHPVSAIALGRAVPDAERAWVFHVSLDGKKSYAVASVSDSGRPGEPYVFDLRDGVSRKLCKVTDLDPKLADFD